MTGFLYLKTPAGFDVPAPAQFAPEPAAAAWIARREPFSEGLWTWGSPAGDVWFSGGSSGDGEFLVLSGYITAFKNGPSFRSQSELVKFLLGTVNGGASSQDLAALFERAHGSFSVLYRSAKSGRLICVTDRVASRPLWFYKRDGVTALSTHPSAIAAALRLSTFDKAAIASLLLYGGPVEPRVSLFKGVSGIDPGSLWELEDQAEPERRRWFTFRHNPDARLSRSEWTRLAAERLTTAAHRILELDANPVLFFSGGTDSRLAAAALKAAGGNPFLVILADSANTEVKIAGRAAKALGLQHEILWRDRLWYLRGLPRAVFESAGSYLWTHAHFSQAAARIASSRPGAAFMLGDFCEAFSKLCCSVEAAARGPLTEERFLAEFDQLHLPDYQPINRGASLSFLRPDVREEAVAALRSNLARRYRELRPGTLDPAVFADRFLRWDHAGTIATFFVFLDLRSAAPDRNLMFDPDVQSLLEVLPAGMRDSANLGARLIAQLWPRAAWVPNSNSLLPMCFPPAAHKFTKVCKPLLGKARRWWMRDPYTTTGSWPRRHVLYLGDPAWRGFIEKVIAEAESLDPAVFDHDAIRRAWQDLVNGNPRRATDVEKVVLLSETTRMLQTGVARYAAQAPEERLGAESGAVRRRTTGIGASKPEQRLASPSAPKTIVAQTQLNGNSNVIE